MNKQYTFKMNQYQFTNLVLKALKEMNNSSEIGSQQQKETFLMIDKLENQFQKNIDKEFNKLIGRK